MARCIAARPNDPLTPLPSLPRPPHCPRRAAPVTARIRAVGAFSRFERCRPDRGAGRPGRSALVLQGSGGSEVTARQLREAAAATPGWEWTVLGGATGSWVADPWALLCHSD